MGSVEDCLQKLLEAGNEKRKADLKRKELELKRREIELKEKELEVIRQQLEIKKEVAEAYLDAADDNEEKGNYERADRQREKANAMANQIPMGAMLFGGAVPKAIENKTDSKDNSEVVEAEIIEEKS